MANTAGRQRSKAAMGGDTAVTVPATIKPKNVAQLDGWGYEVNERIEKKLSKRLCEIAPSIFSEAWKDDHGIMCVGGGSDYWGEFEDAYTCWEWWRDNWLYFIECDGVSIITDDGEWNDKIPQYRMKPKSRYLISLAKIANHYRKVNSDW